MIVLQLCQRWCPDKIPSNISSKRIGDGADGEVFELADDPNKVIKLCVLYDTGSVGYKQTYQYITKSIDHLVQHPHPSYALVYEHVYMGEGSRQVVWGNTHKEQPFLLYYYVMEKLGKISEDEAKVFHTILSHEDRGIKKNFSADQLKEILTGLRRGLDFDVEKVILFHDNLKNAPLAHLDIHVRNIMKDANGYFKMIDFDRVQMGDGRNAKAKSRGQSKPAKRPRQ